jgi:hypothetical protein
MKQAEALGTVGNTSSIKMTAMWKKNEGYKYEQDVYWKFGLGYELEISAQVAGAGPKATSKVNFEVGMEFKKEWSRWEEIDLSFELSQNPRVGYTLMCIGFFEYGQFDMGYDSLVTLELQGGKTWQFRERGIREATLYGKAQTVCADEKGDHRGKDPQEFIERNLKKSLGQLAKENEKKNNRRDEKLVARVLTA